MPAFRASATELDEEVADEIADEEVADEKVLINAAGPRDSRPRGTSNNLP